MDTSGITVDLPATPQDGDTYVIKDGVGIGDQTVDGNGHNIDGSATFLMGTSYQSIVVVFCSDLNEWMVISSTNP